MKHLKKLILESGEWWVEYLKNFDLDDDEILDYFTYIIDEFDISPSISKSFYDENFNYLSKKSDTIDRDFFIGFKITIPIYKEGDIKTHIEFQELLNKSLLSLSQNFNSKITHYGGHDYQITCFDISQPLGVIETKKKNRNIEWYFSRLSLNRKILYLKKDGNKIFITQKVNEYDIDWIETRLRYMFNNDSRVRISSDNEKITLEVIDSMK